MGNYGFQEITPEKAEAIEKYPATKLLVFELLEVLDDLLDYEGLTEPDPADLRQSFCKARKVYDKAKKALRK